MKPRSLWILAGLCGMAIAEPRAAADDVSPDELASVLVQAPPLEVGIIRRAVGMTGVMRQGVLEMSRQRRVLKVLADGVELSAGRVARAAFAGHEDRVVVMVNVPVTPDELPGVLRAAKDGGLTVPSAANALPGTRPAVVNVHLSGVGDARRLATTVRTVFAALAPPDQTDAVTARRGPELDAHELDQALGTRGELAGGIYTARLMRKNIAVGTSHVTLPGPLAQAFVTIQGSPDRAALIGDLTVLSDELGEVLRVLRRAHLRVGALFNPLRQQPRVFRVHFWGTGRAETLAAAVRRALAATRP